MSYARSYNPIWSFVDLVGQQLDDTYYLFTLQNTLPYLPSNVYQSADGTTPWTNPIQFLANGTLPENIYFDDTLVYRLEIRHGNTQDDALIYLVENYIPNQGSDPAPSDATTNNENQITNPQFADVYFDTSFLISASGTYSIAPGWDIVVTGSGTLTVTQDTYSGDSFSQSNPTNAPYGISLQNLGFTTVVLRQRFNGNGALWTGAENDEAEGPGVALNVTASSDVPLRLTGAIKYNDGVRDTDLIIRTLTTQNAEYYGAQPILFSTNTALPDTAWTEVEFSFQGSATVHITSVQLVGQAVVGEIPYQQTTLERQVDEEFNVFKEPLFVKPIPSALVGWDFPMNPAQFGVSGSTAGLGGANKSTYAWDQTILFSSADGGLSFDRETSGKTIDGFKVTIVSDTSWAMIQYIPTARARELLGDTQCASMMALASATVTGNISLWYTKDANLPSLTSANYNSLIVSITDGFPTCGSGGVNGTWTQVSNRFGNQHFSLDTDVQQLQFSGWDALDVAESELATYMAIVVSFDTMVAAQTVSFEYVGLFPGEIATRPAPQTRDQVLRECQYYWETSFTVGTDVPTATVLGSYFAIQNTFRDSGLNLDIALSSAFRLYFKQTKRAIPDIVIYSGGTTDPDKAEAYIYNSVGSNAVEIAFSTYWTVPPNGADPSGTTYISNSATGMTNTTSIGATNPYAAVTFQYYADARLGIIN